MSTPGTRITVDGLWKCLCPSVDVATLLRAVGRPKPFSTTSTTNNTSTTSTTAKTASTHSRNRRRLNRPSVGCLTTHDGTNTWTGRSSIDIHCHCLSTSRRFASNGASTLTSPIGRVQFVEARLQDQKLREDGLPWVQVLLRIEAPYGKELHQAPTAAIYAALRQLQDGHQRNTVTKIHAFVRHLVDDRHEPPSAPLYEALIRANCSPTGSADAVKDLLDAMHEAKVEGTASLYHGALAALVMHPDYMLRNRVLEAMQDRWMELAPEGKQNVALGLLRDGQYERALDYLDAMDKAETEGKGTGINGTATATITRPPQWLYDVFVYVLAEEGFLDEALRIVNHRLLRLDQARSADNGSSGGGRWKRGGSSTESDVSPTMWSFLLDTCVQQGHGAGLHFVWQRAVRTRLVTPSDATGMDVLGLAAKHEDPSLAAEVLQLLAARGTKLSMPHFEAVVDSYARALRIDKALQALCIMDDAGFVPDTGSTRELYQALVRQAKNLGSVVKAVSEKVVDDLFSLRSKHGRVPPAGFNVVLEALLTRMKTDRGRSRSSRNNNNNNNDSFLDDRPLPDDQIDAALDLYRHVRQLCIEGPNFRTFRLLMTACYSPEQLNFLENEMRHFRMRPTVAMVDRLVLANAQHGTLDMALYHFFKLTGRGDARVHRTALPLSEMPMPAEVAMAEVAEATAEATEAGSAEAAADTTAQSEEATAAISSEATPEPAAPQPATTDEATAQESTEPSTEIVAETQGLQETETPTTEATATPEVTTEPAEAKEAPEVQPPPPSTPTMPQKPERSRKRTPPKLESSSLHMRPFITRTTTEVLIRRCLVERDPRLADVVEAGRERGRPIEPLIQAAKRAMLREGVLPSESQSDVSSSDSHTHKVTAYGVPRPVGLEDDSPIKSEDSMSV